MSFRDVRFAASRLCGNLYYFARTGEEWFEVSYATWKLYHEITQPFRAVYYVFWRIWKYRSILWNDFDWDHHFLLDLLELKFKSMGHYHLHHGNLERSGETALELFDLAETIQRIRKEDYTIAEDAAHEAKWGKASFNMPPAMEYGTDKLGKPRMYSWHMQVPNATTKDLEKQESEERRAIYKLGEDRLQADVKHLSEGFLKIMEWWD